MFKIKFNLKLFLLMFCVLVFGCKESQDTDQSSNGIPAHLVGVWASKNSVMDGPAIFEGIAVYLGADGVGAIIAGPPAIGYRIVATFEKSSNTIVYEMTEDGMSVEKGKILYDPNHRTLTLRQNGEVLIRRFDKLDDNTREDLGLEAN
jgi:hypothetical protein